VSAPGLLIFDMDGVLVEVTESYREATRLTFEHFTGVPLSNGRIQEFKNQGGWNDDWALCFRLIRDAGIEIGFDTVVARFQRFFRGENGEPGLIQREKWIANDGLFDRLKQNYRLSIFTGRLREEASVTLNRFAPNLFDPVIGTDDVTAPKPAPDGLILIKSQLNYSRLFYLGDTVDDANSALAAQVPFIGITGAATPHREETIRVLKQQGALIVLESINELEAALAHL
jgi:HAD superfamily phosphatase